MKIGRLVLRSSLVAVFGLAVWMPQAEAQQMKIGYVNVSHVFESTNEGRAILKRLKAEHAKKQKELDARMKAFQQKAQQFQQQSAMLKEEVRKDRIQKLSKEEQQLQALFMQYQGEINKKKSDALGKFEQKVMGVVQVVAKREGLDYIVRQEMLLFGPDKMDMTNQVIREYDKRHSAKKGKKGK